MLRLTEEDIDQTFVFLFPAAAIGDHYRHNKNRKINLLLDFEQRGDSIIRAIVFNKFRFSQMNENAFSAGNFPLQKSQLVGTGLFPFLKQSPER